MQVFRISSGRYPADSSDGARLYGARWHWKGTPVIYTSTTTSLAALEVIVNKGLIPSDYRIVMFDLPDWLDIESVDPYAISAAWPHASSIPETAAFGTLWAKSLRTPILQVPSAVIRNEHNYILNPLHPDFSAITFSTPGDHIDDRLRTLGLPPVSS